MTLTKIGASLSGGANIISITQAGHGLTLGYPVKANSNGTYAHATADTAANAEAIGIITEVTTDTMRIALSGRITVDGCVPNLSAGTVLFLQVSAGLLAAAEPSGNTQVSKPMAVITYANSEMILLAYRGEVISTAGITLADGSVDNDAMADNAINTAEIVNDAVTADKLANSINTEIAANTAKTGITSGQASAITANTAKVTNATHTGDVTGATALTIATDAVDIGMLSASGTADSTTFLRGDNAWAAAGGGAVVLEGVNLDGTGSYQTNSIEATTTSTAGVDLLAATSLSIIAAEITHGIVSGRKTAAQQKGGLGLKVNGTIVLEAVGDAHVIWSADTNNEAQNGMGTFWLGGRVSNYTHGLVGISRGSTPAGVARTQGTVTVTMDNAVPTAEITSITMRGIVDNSSLTLGADELHIYSLTAS